MVKKALVTLGLLLMVAVSATSALAAAPPGVLTATVSPTCTTYGITLQAMGLSANHQYEIDWAIQGLGTDISGSTTFTATSSTYGVTINNNSISSTLNGTFTPSGTATLINVTESNRVDDTVPITFSPSSVTCTGPGQPQLSVTKSPKNGTFVSGSQVSFSIIVGNPGGSTATNVKLDDQLPSSGGLSFTSVTTTQGTCTLSTANFLHCDLGPIGPGSSATITVSSGTSTPDTACQLQSNPHATATADNNLMADDFGSTNCAPPNGKIFTIGPSSMEGAIRISNGDWVNGGYSFQFKSNSHIATDYTVTASVSITGPCSNGGTDTVIVPLGTVGYNVAAGDTNWLPTGDANSVLSWEGSVQVGVTSPPICGGAGTLNASKGAVYTATVSQNPPTGSLVAFRFKYRDPLAKGKPNTNCLDTSDPNRARADVCGASWSQTVTDP